MKWLVILLILLSACSLPLDKIEQIGETTQQVGEAVKETGKVIPSPVGPPVELVGTIITAVGSVITGYAIHRARRNKKVAQSLVQTFEEKGQPEQIKTATKKARELGVSPDLEALVTEVKKQ